MLSVMLLRPLFYIMFATANSKMNKRRRREIRLKHVCVEESEPKETYQDQSGINSSNIVMIRSNKQTNKINTHHQNERFQQHADERSRRSNRVNIGVTSVSELRRPSTSSDEAEKRTNPRRKREQKGSDAQTASNCDTSLNEEKHMFIISPPLLEQRGAVWRECLTSCAAQREKQKKVWRCCATEGGKKKNHFALLVRRPNQQLVRKTHRSFFASRQIRCE